MPEPYTPTADEMQEAWLKWSAWRRVPTQGAGVAGPEFDRFMAGYVRKPSREELADAIAGADALTGIGMRWFPSGELTPQAYAIADAILTLLERTDR